MGAALRLDAPTYAPLLVMAAVPVLSQMLGVPMTGVHAVVVLSVSVTACLLAGAKVRVEGPAVRPVWRARLGSPAWLMGGTLVFILICAGLVLARYRAYNYWGVDLAQFDQALWNTWQGRILAFTQYGGLSDTLLTDHFEPLMFLIAPLYLIWPDPRALLLLRVVALALGGWLVYHLALRHAAIPFVAVCAGLAYLIHPTITGGALDAGASVRPDLLTIPLFLSALLALEEKRWKTAVVFTVLAMACKEYVAVIVVMLGFYVVYRYRRPRLGLFMSLLGVAWLVGVLGVFLPMVRGGSSSLHFALNFGHMGGAGGAGGIVATILSQPGQIIGLAGSERNLLAIFFSLLSLALLPIAHPPLALVGLPVVAIFALAGTPSLFDFHLGPVFPFVFVAALVGTANLARRGSCRLQLSEGRLRASLAAILFAASLSAALFWSSGPLGFGFWTAGRPYAFWGNFYVADAHDHRTDNLVAQVPVTEPVIASEFLVARLARRPEVYHFFDPPTAQQLAGVDTAVVDLFDINVPKSVSLRTVVGASDEAAPTMGRDLVRQLLVNGGFRLVLQDDGLLLLKRAGSTPVSGWDLEIATVATGQLAATTLHDFGDRMRLVSYDLSPASDTPRHYRVTYDWQVLDGFAEPFEFRYGINAEDDVQTRSTDYVLVDTFTGRQGEAYRVVHLPSFLLRPPAEWRAGELLRETYEFELPADLPAGSYHWQVGLYTVPRYFAIDTTPERWVPGTVPFSMPALVVQQCGNAQDCRD
jgi:uncharacterized membrane protein